MNRTGSLVFSVLSIFFAGMIYICFRSEHLVMFQWFDNFGILPTVYHLRNLVSTISVPNFLIYSLPDALWVYSLTSIIAAIWINKKILLYIWLAFCGILSIGYEIAQYFHIIKGTYDNLDLAFLITFYLIALLQSLLIIKSQNHENTTQPC